MLVYSLPILDTLPKKTNCSPVSRYFMIFHRYFCNLRSLYSKRFKDSTTHPSLTKTPRHKRSTMPPHCLAASARGRSMTYLGFLKSWGIPWLKVRGYKIFSGWWCIYPSEKYESQLRLLFPIYGKIKNVPNHQPVEKIAYFWGF